MKTKRFKKERRNEKIKSSKLEILKEILAKNFYQIDMKNGVVTGKYGNPLGSINNKGYLKINLCHKHKYYNFYIHHIIACCGGLDMSETLTINHKDGNKLNNRLSNLESITNQENVKHAWKSGLCQNTPYPVGQDNPSTKLTAEQVKQIRQEYVPRKMTFRMLADKYGVSHVSIIRIVNHQNWQHVN